MNIAEKLRGAMRRIAGVSADSALAGDKRRTVALPSIFNTYGTRADAMPKLTPVNLRRFAETPVARKASATTGASPALAFLGFLLSDRTSMEIASERLSWRCERADAMA